MDPQSLIVFLIVGAVAGWLAGVIVKGHGFGLIGNIVVGIVGAFIAGWLLPSLGLGLTGIVGAIVYALIGAVILLVIIGFVKRAT
ncbi:MAG TPA: GlsB/YeaQ/YmgE family stress response membrane protein [Rhodanobacteraceae bacterium]